MPSDQSRPPPPQVFAKHRRRGPSPEAEAAPEAPSAARPVWRRPEAVEPRPAEVREPPRAVAPPPAAAPAARPAPPRPPAPPPLPRASARSIEDALAEDDADAGAAPTEAEPEPEDAPWAISDEDAFRQEMDRLMKGGSSGRRGEYEEGDRVRGKVVQLSGDFAFVDIGAKAEATIPIAELAGEEGEPGVGIGDRIDAHVVAVTSEGIQLSRRMAVEARSREAVREAYASRLPLEGRIVSRNKGGYEVRFQSGQKAFMPVSQVELGHVADDLLDDYVGRSFRLRITKYDGDGRDIVVSRAALQKEEREVQADETRATLKVGDVRTGVVRRVTDFGAFVDLGGVDGLVHASEIAWSRVEKPEDVLRVGQSVRVKVVRLEPEKNRIALSMKQAAGDPWDEVGTRFQVGGVYEGRVTRNETFGSFVELTPGLEGLVHVSRMSWQRVRHPDNVVEPGQAVTVKLVEVDTLRRRLGLSMKDVAGDPWEDHSATWEPGTLLEGTVEKFAPFGVFVRLAEAITGLVPNEELGMDPAQARRALTPDKPIQVEILTIDRAERRIRLALATGDKAGEREAMKDYRGQQRSAPAKGGSPQGGGGFGTFGDLLKGFKPKG